MRASKPMISLGLGVFAIGMIYDAAANAGAIKGDGHDHTASRVPVAVATATDATDTIIRYVNYTTGEEISVPPRERRAKSVQTSIAYPHASYLLRRLGSGS
jgi:hypothetical protein